jgi:NAD+ kinase
MRRIGILGHAERDGVRDAARRLARRLARTGRVVRMESSLAARLGAAGEPLGRLAAWCDVLVALGGDGTALLGGRALVDARGALLPLNLGGLGFLAVAEAREMDEALRAALGGAWPVATRSIVRARVLRGGRTAFRGAALNDAVIKSATGFAALHLRLQALEQDLGHVVADGLIAATPTGSTGYALSAGGPVLAPGVEALVLAPVCAHSLGTRPLLLPEDCEIAVRMLKRADSPVLLLDGHDRFPLEPRDVIRVRLERGAVRVFHNPERPFLATLRRKLGWQGSARRSV